MNRQSDSELPQVRPQVIAPIASPDCRAVGERREADIGNDAKIASGTAEERVAGCSEGFPCPKCCSVMQPKQQARPARQGPTTEVGGQVLGLQSNGPCKRARPRASRRSRPHALPSEQPCLLLRDFCVEPIPPHPGEWVLVHGPDLPHRPEAVNWPSPAESVPPFAGVGGSTLPVAAS